MKNGQIPGPPAGLSPEARRWWKSLTVEYQISDVGGQFVLGSALESFDRAAEARRQIEKHGLLIADRFGHQRANPAIAVERRAVEAMLRAVKLLNLDLEPIGALGHPRGKLHDHAD